MAYSEVERTTFIPGLCPCLIWASSLKLKPSWSPPPLAVSHQNRKISINDHRFHLSKPARLRHLLPHDDILKNPFHTIQVLQKCWHQWKYDTTSEFSLYVVAKK